MTVLLIAVFSDTHGNAGAMSDAIEKTRPEAVIFLGDGIADAKSVMQRYPDMALYAVRGNCDILSTAQVTLTENICGVKVFMTHGHEYGVKGGLERLLNAAHFSRAQLVLYGHTHVAHSERVGEMHVLNPGSAGRGERPSFALVRLKSGKVSSIEHVELDKM